MRTGYGSFPPEHGMTVFFRNNERAHCGRHIGADKDFDFGRHAFAKLIHAHNLICIECRACEVGIGKRQLRTRLHADKLSHRPFLVIATHRDARQRGKIAALCIGQRRPEADKGAESAALSATASISEARPGTRLSIASTVTLSIIMAHILGALMQRKATKQLPSAVDVNDATPPVNFVSVNSLCEAMHSLRPSTVGAVPMSTSKLSDSCC